MNIARKRIAISMCITKDAFLVPRAETTGLDVSERKGQKIGLCTCIVTSNNTWDIFPRKAEKTRARDKLHILSTLRLSILNKLLTKDG